MQTELCRVTTADGLQLEGALSVGETSANGHLPIDAFLLIHGTGSNFYAAGLLERFAEQAIRTGVTTLRINTRGHDAVAWIPSLKGSVLGGAAYEVVADCMHDVRAWVDFLVARGCHHIALVGHSMGGVKAIYTQALDAHDAVSHVIAISAPRFSHRQLISHPQADDFRLDFQRATALVRAHRGDELIRVRQPLPMLLTASGFLAKYGPEDDYNLLRYLPDVRVPVLYLVGTLSMESSPAFAGLSTDIAALQDGNANLTFEIVDGANTVYTGCQELPFLLSASWLQA